MMMKICDITLAFTETSGGIRTYIEAKRNYLIKNTDCQHVLILPGKSDSFQQIERCTRYEIKSPLIPKCEPYRFIFRLDKVFRILLREKPDVIELDNAYLLPWIAFIFRKIFRCVVIGFYHTDFPTAYVKPFVTGLMNRKWGERAERLAWKYARLVYRKCDATFVASSKLRRKLAASNRGRFIQIHLGVDLEIFRQSRRNPAWRAELGLKDEDILLIYAGRFDIEKRVRVLIEAFRLVPKSENCYLLLVGNGPLRIELDETSRLNPQIKILDYQADRFKLAEIMASGDIYLTAGPYETYGLCVVEAQSCGLPVVGVRSGALIERVPAALGLLGAVDSPEEMARNIQIISGNGFQKMGLAARETVELNNSWPHIFARIFTVYQETLAAAETKKAKLTSPLATKNEILES